MTCMFRVCIIITYLNAPHCRDGNADYLTRIEPAIYVSMYNMC